ncbi:dethiobiotin synthase, partial [Streptomyces sp. YC419]|nr:dethiobiotin synthase [Streptomyces ureilyticus]
TRPVRGFQLRAGRAQERGRLRPADFRAAAPSWLARPLGGTWDAEAFAVEQGAE